MQPHRRRTSSSTGRIPTTSATRSTVDPPSWITMVQRMGDCLTCTRPWWRAQEHQATPRPVPWEQLRASAMMLQNGWEVDHMCSSERHTCTYARFFALLGGCRWCGKHLPQRGMGVGGLRCFYSNILGFRVPVSVLVGVVGREHLWHLRTLFKILI